MQGERYLTFYNTDNISTLSLLSNQDTGDYFSIGTTTHGATTLTTVDDDATAAHLTFYPDGDLKNQAKSGINYWYASTNTDDYLKLEIGANGDATFTTVDAAAAAANMTFTPDGQFLVNSDDIRFTSDQANDPLVQIRGEANDATGPRLRFMKNRGGDGQDNDVCGTIQFYSYDDGTPSTQHYGRIQTTIHDATSGQESGQLTLAVASHDGGVDNGLVLTGGSADTEVDVTVGNGTSSVTTIAGTLTMGSTAFVNNSGVVQVATQGTIDHDSLANFVANEHIDWTGSSAGTIHSTNIPTLNQDTTGSAATLTTARAFQTDLASTSTANFDGSAANTHGVTGTLAVGNGGTGNTSGNATGLTASTSNSIGVGSIELGHADDTTIARSASGIVSVEGKNIRTEDRHLFIKQGSFSGNLGTSETFFPMTGTAEATVANGIAIPFIAPVNGKLLKIHWRTNKDHSGQVTTFRLINWDDNEAFTLGNQSDLGEKAVTPANQNNVTTIDFQSGLDSGTNAFTAGETVGISMQNASAVNSGSTTKYWYTAVFELDFSSY
jgi:hypothetical protein